MEITELLLNAQSTDYTVRSNAEHQLSSAESTNFGSFVQSLSSELCNESKPLTSRQLAGLLLKNSIDAKDRALKSVYTQRWIQLDGAIKNELKPKLLKNLSSIHHEARHVTAQIVAKIGVVELPNSSWPELLPHLLETVGNSSSSLGAIQSCLETLGYLCEESYSGNMPTDVMTAQSNAVLTAVVQGMRFDGKGMANADGSMGTNDVAGVNGVRVAASTALLNALDFVSANFERENERSFIMQTICECISATDMNVRQTALECLVKVAENYYAFLPQYMTVLYGLVVDAMKAHEEAIALQAIEFWSTVAEEEIALSEEEAAAAEMGTVLEGNRKSYKFIEQAMPVLCPVLFECLMSQEEEQDDDSWNRSTAAGACFVVLADANRSKIVEIVLPFIQSRINDQTNWRAREAATMALGSIVDGPPVEQLDVIAAEAIPLLVNALATDSQLAVRDTTAWTLGRLCSAAGGSLSAVELHRVALMEAFVKALSDEPAVARNAAWAIHNLAEAFDYESGNSTGTLSPYSEVLLSKLWQTTSRDDGDMNNLRASAYEALNTLLQSIPQDGMKLIVQLVPLLLERLESSVQKSSHATGQSEEEKEEAAELHGLLCGSLQTCTQRLMRSGTLDFADRMMLAYISVMSLGSSGGSAQTNSALDSSAAPGARSGALTGSVHEEALMAVGALADAMEADFIKYLPHVAPFVILGLRNWEQYQVCAVAVGVVGDIARAVESAIMPYADDIVALLLTALQSAELDKSVKPPILSVFGDLAMALGGEFERYVSHVMQMLQQAAQSSVTLEVSVEDYDMQDWVVALRLSIFEAYTGILQGLKTASKQSLLYTHVEWIVSFCQVVYRDEVNSTFPESDRLLPTAAGVMGDIASTMSGTRSHLASLPWLREMLQKAADSPDSSARETVEWAGQAIYYTR